MEITSSPTITWTVFRRVTFQTEFNYITTYTVRTFGVDVLRRSQNVVEEAGAVNSKIIYKCHLACTLFTRVYDAYYVA